jgi:hypothetical protein
MKYFSWSKGFIVIALACSIIAQGSTVFPIGSKNQIQKNEPKKVYSVTVTSSQVQNNPASANLTISGENSKISVEKQGTVTLVAGESIVLHPGTKISTGSFLYASIEPRTKVGKHQKKEAKLVTLEENLKIELQADLSFAYQLFSPFPTHNKGYLHAGDAEQGSFNSSSNELSGLAPEQQRKVAVESRFLPEVTRNQNTINYTFIPAVFSFRAETMMVLRL